MSRIKGILLLALLTAWSTTGCLAQPFSGSEVTVDFLTDLDPNGLVRLPDGSATHYELWVQFEDEGVYSVGRFVVDSSLHVLRYPDEAQRIGSVTGADDLRRSGVRFTSLADLSGADTAFVTAEPNGETDIAPSGYVLMEGPLAVTAEGELRGQMTGEYTNRLGEVRRPVSRITILIAEDNVFF